ncbi:hypothetical protein EAF04_008315 [Stromatinia cepivora]|nr:hypothetical protein EAF04_008315 [Stromatinia cepivora]
MRGSGANGNDQNMDGYEQIQEDTQDATDSRSSARRLSLDGHLNHRQLTLSMDGLADLRAERTDDIISNEEATRGNTTIQSNTYSIFGDDMVISSPNSLLLPVYIPDSSLPAEVELLMREDYYNNHITSLQQQGLLLIGTEPISIPTGKEHAIRKILTPVTSDADELELCFCGTPYADPTSKGEMDSHEPVKMPECPHVFGKHCIVQWLSENKVPTCPMCRKKVILVMDVPVERMDDQELYRVIDYHYLQPE